MYICTRSQIKMRVFQVERGRNWGLHLANKHKCWRRDKLGGQAKELSGGAGQATGAWGFCYRSLSVQKDQRPGLNETLVPFWGEKGFEMGKFWGVECWNISAEFLLRVPHLGLPWWGGWRGQSVLPGKDPILADWRGLQPFLKICPQKSSPIKLWYSWYLAVFGINMWLTRSESAKTFCHQSFEEICFPKSVKRNLFKV